MNRRKEYFLLIFFLTFILVQSLSAGGSLKYIRVGNVSQKILDWGPAFGAYWGGLYNYYDGFSQGNLTYGIWGIGVYDWTDDAGVHYPTFVDVESEDGMSEGYIHVVEYEPGLTIRRYFRDRPAEILVDDFHLEEPYPQYGDTVNASKISGTADVMVESHIRTHVGVDIYQKVLGWSQHNHDDYVIFDWTLVHTGNTDLDDSLELPEQTLDSLYFGRNWAGRPSPSGWHQAWHSVYGQHPGDSMRLVYAYPSRKKGSTYDTYGFVDYGTGFLQDPEWTGLLTAHVDKSPDDHSDDPAQPQMTANLNPWETCVSRWGTYERQAVGFKPEFGIPYLQDLGEDVYPNTHHHPEMDDIEYWGSEYPEDYPHLRWIITSTLSHGPYWLEPGDSIRFVWALVMGTISPQTGWEIGKAWKEGNADETWDGPYKLPPAWHYYDIAPTDNDKAKDSWVTTGKDSLFKNAWNALWAVNNNYQVPIPPPAPSIAVSGKPDLILVEWGDESESAPDFAGYRVYKAKGSTYYDEWDGVVKGDWEMIFECGEGTDNTLTHWYEDTQAERGVAYFYYVSAFDDGSHPEVSASYQGGVDGVAESLESCKYLNMTTEPTYLTRPPGEELSDIRIVPNPLNVSAAALQYPGEPNKIMFLDLPPRCTIRIYNESGDLIRTLQHTDGSGDEVWDDPTGQHFITTESQQVPVSGLYIAHIETPDGRSTNLTFYIIR